MKRSLATVVILLAIFIGGCNTQGPPGQQGPQGQQGQQGDQGRSGQQDRRGDQGRPGEQDRRGDQGQSGQRDPGACPAGQHRYTDPANGEVRCVRD
jgi:hypothetical protein